MAKKFLTDIDLAKNSLNNARIQNLGADPSTPVVGQTYFNTSSNKQRTFNGTTWDEYGTSTASGTVTGVSVVTANGLAGTVATPSSTPAITLTTTVTGIIKGNGTAISAATAGTDYTTPSSTETVTNKTISGASNTFSNIPESAVSNLTSDLSAKAPLNSPTFTGTVTVPTPSNATDAATKAYVDAAAAGIDWKASVRVIATANITLSGTQTIDGVAVVAGDRVLAAGQSTASANGIYVVAAGAWSRATDADTSAEVTSGMAVFIEEGTTNDNTAWVLTTNGAITLGTTSLSFVQFTGLGEVTAGTGLTKSGNTISIDTTTTVDKTTAQALTNKDLTGAGNTFPTFNQNTTGSAATLTTSRTINGIGFNGSANITVPNATRFTALIGDGTTTAIPVTHSLGQQYVVAQVFDATSNLMVECDVTLTSSTVTTFTFITAPSTNQYRVVIVG